MLDYRFIGLVPTDMPLVTTQTSVVNLYSINIPSILKIAEDLVDLIGIESMIPSIYDAGLSRVSMVRRATGAMKREEDAATIVANWKELLRKKARVSHTFPYDSPVIRFPA